MKRKNQYIFAVIILIFTALLLFGCGKKARKLTEEEVKTLFKNHVIENYQECSFTDYTVEVTRLDSSAEDVCYADATVSASNDNLFMEVKYSTYYYLNENKEWIPGEIEVIDGYYNVTSSDLTEEDARSYISEDYYCTNEEYHDILLTDHQLNLEGKKDMFVFSAKTTKTETRLASILQFEEYEYEEDRTIKVIFKYGLYSGWSLSKVDISGKGIINLSGDTGISLAPSEIFR